ncbi:ubiquitin-like protein 4A [Acipenser ruthenus]|uniref:ubiquitin-like protein 4A n=1 Tax=Acipenser ruthenus TaxID=7906 RepID=UPI00274269DF|nr:ubiquitin-like protein 4A [Acipenser ruthenus]
MLIPSLCVCVFLSLDRSVRMRRSPQSGVWSLTGSTYLSINRDSSTKARRWQDYERRLRLLSLDDMERLATRMLHPEAVECMELSFLD